MSGTSLDGVDAALIETDGVGVRRTGHAVTVPYAPDFRERLRAVLGDRGDVAGAARELTLRHAEAVGRLLEAAGVAAAAVAVAGFHGQTILHRPAERLTRQIGDGALLAAATGIAVVDDFRSADVAAGGRGAAGAGLSPRPGGRSGAAAGRPQHRRRRQRHLDRPGRRPVAFDTGPGNALVDDWVLATTGRPFDAGGALAATGRVDAAVLGRLLAYPYFARPAPKSLDRDELGRREWAHLSPADGAATLAAFTVEAVAAGRDLVPSAPRRWLVGGGGRHNAALLDGLRGRLGVPVDPVEAVGWDGDALEAEAFAFLAVRAARPAAQPAGDDGRAAADDRRARLGGAGPRLNDLSRAGRSPRRWRRHGP